jgi:hypothetical protein
MPRQIEMLDGRIVTDTRGTSPGDERLVGFPPDAHGRQL